ncbi:MAG TPA: primosomal protein N' [Clostridiaceae bacterium]|nr:primosomal protein N' [Clostridiaceae bacterium]
MKCYCYVVLAYAARHFDREWTYRIPESLKESIDIGSVVNVPFGTRKTLSRGFVTRFFDSPPGHYHDNKIRDIDSLLSPRPVVTEEQVKLAYEMKRRYYCSVGDALNAMVPPTVLSVGDRRVKAARLIDTEEATELLDSGDLRSMKQVRVIELLLEHEEAPCTEIRQAADVSQGVLNTLAKNGVIEFFQRSVPRTLPEELEEVEPAEAFEATEAQQEAIEKIDGAAHSVSLGSLREFMLFGVTGSGKTEVYLQVADRVLSRGQQVLILVPEIALTPQMTRRLIARFGDRVAILHSRLTPAGRYETWQRILAQEIPIVVGARSAVFAPLNNLGLIVVDEEQESSYKAEMKPRYYAIDIARIRAMMNGAVLVLGSATPQVSSYWRAHNGLSTLLRLPERISEVGMADVEVVDMRREYARGNLSIFSKRLTQELSYAIERGEQAMILLNRRGFSRTIICRNCGWQMRCPFCDIALTSHRNPYGEQSRLPNRMVCHLCERLARVPKHCPECGSEEIMAFGAGTQQVEEEIRKQLPHARILRMDLDTTRGRFSHKEILDAFERHEADILVGTQMIAKGHDFHDVTLSAILSADQLLGTGEFRASEQAFQLMTQVAGRSGRGLKKGRVIIQAVQPDHFVVRAAAKQDYEAFYREEIVFRKRMEYLPFGHVGMAQLKGFDRYEVEDTARAFHRDVALLIRRYGGTFARTVLSEVSPAPIERIRSRYRYRVMVRDESAENLTRLLFMAADDLKRPKGVSLVIDIDPWTTF